MPYPRKKPPQTAAGGGSGVSRFVSGLRPEGGGGGGGGGGGSLVVQTGFPTSLADLFLKNRSRLKMPSWKKRKKLPETTASSDAAAAAAPDHVAALEARPWGNADAVSEVRQNNTGFGIASGSLLIVAGVMVALAIERKKLVGGIMLSAVVLWLLDSLGFQNLRSRTPRSDASSTASGRWNLQGRGFVSPIREIGIDGCSDSAGSDRSSADSIDEHQHRQFLLEKRDFSAIRKVQNTKKLLSKLVPKKFGAQKRNTNQNDLFSALSVKDDFNGVTEIEEEESTNESDDSDHPSAFCIRDILRINASAESIQEHGYGNKARSSQQLVFCAVLLTGLLGGKSLALALSLSWFLLQKSVKGFWS